LQLGKRRNRLHRFHRTVLNFNAVISGGRAMSTSRRNFLKSGSLVALAAGVPMSFASKALGSEEALSSSGFSLNKTAFLSQLNTDFLLSHGGSKVAIRLVAVSDLPRRGASLSGEGFSLVFRGNRERPLRQATYVIEHDQLGEFSFLVVPILRRDQSSFYYEAVVNRLRP